MKRKRKWSVMLLFLLLGVVLVGTFAWVQIKDARINRMKTNAITDGSVHLNETFISKDNWAIGTENDKRVSVTNAGDSQVFVRVSFEEVLTFYKNNAQAKEVATPAASDKDFPVKFSADSYAASSGWIDVPSGQFSPALPNNVKVKVKGTKVSETQGDGSQVEKANIEYVIYHEYATKKYQKMSAVIQLDAFKDATPDKWTYTITNLQYFVYEGQETVGKDWAGVNQLLGEKGTKYGVAFDYSALKNTPITLATANQIPQADATDNTRWLANLQADAQLDNALYTVYHANAMTNTVQKGKWMYNATDGYFYYLDVVKSGETTQEFLKAIGLNNNASQKYSDMTFDLIVNLEAIQAVKEAVTDAAGNNGGWAMSGTDPIAVHLKSLVNH